MTESGSCPINYALLFAANSRPHRCAQCGRAFSTSSKLAAHYRLHNNDRPYVCTIADCGARYTTRDALHKHGDTHRPVGAHRSAHSCNLCDKSYRHASSLAKHRIKHRTVVENMVTLYKFAGY